MSNPLLFLIKIFSTESIALVCEPGKFFNVRASLAVGGVRYRKKPERVERQVKLFLEAAKGLPIHSRLHAAIHLLRAREDQWCDWCVVFRRLINGVTPGEGCILDFSDAVKVSLICAESGDDYKREALLLMQKLRDCPGAADTFFDPSTRKEWYGRDVQEMVERDWHQIPHQIRLYDILHDHKETLDFLGDEAILDVVTRLAEEEPHTH